MTRRVLLGDDSQSSNALSPNIKELRYIVDIQYMTANGIQIFNGTFLARNSLTAGAKGRDFVLKYFRPMSIDDVAVQLA